jgi:hypothetical protein
MRSVERQENGALEGEEMVVRSLSGELRVRRVKEQTLVARRELDNGGSHLLTRGDVHHQGTGGVRTEVQAECVAGHRGELPTAVQGIAAAAGSAA